MFDVNQQNVDVYNAGDTFKFNVDAVSGTLHKSTRKSKFCVRGINDKQYIFDDEHPRLTANSEEIVVLQTMLCGKEQILVEYMTRKDYDAMFDGPLPDIVVRDMINDIKDKVKEEIKDQEGYDRLVDYDKKDDYDQKKWERRWISEQLAEKITKHVCKYLADKHIAEFDFEHVWFGPNMVYDEFRKTGCETTATDEAPNPWEE